MVHLETKNVLLGPVDLVNCRFVKFAEPDFDVDNFLDCTVVDFTVPQVQVKELLITESTQRLSQTEVSLLELPFFTFNMDVVVQSVLVNEEDHQLTVVVELFGTASTRVKSSEALELHTLVRIGDNLF